MNTKCYRLAKDEELPDEFCAVRDIGGEPSEYAFYVPEAENAKLREENERFIIKLNAEHIARQNVEADNAKLRELVRDMHKALFSLNLDHCQACPREDACVFVHKSFDCDECAFERDMEEMGIEVDE